MRTDVLNIAIGCPQAGGIESFWMQFYGHMDHDRVHYDFLFCGENALAEKAEDPMLRDSCIYSLGVLKEGENTPVGGVKLLGALWKFLRAHPYRVVHIHTGSPIVSALCLMVERLQGVPVRITHSHAVGYGADYRPRTLRERVKAVAEPICRGIVRRLSTHRFACSQAAGEHLYGVGKGDFRVLRNAIDAQAIAWDPAERSRQRAAAQTAASTQVFGCVGRMSPAKNMDFAMEIFRLLHMENPDTALWLVGDGEVRNALEQQAAALGLSDCVRFWGMRSDVPQLMQAMDALLFPSDQEGLGLVAVEAQGAGLPVFASSIVPPETRITELITYLPLAEGAEHWAQVIRSRMNGEVRRNTLAELIAAGYDIHSEAKALQDFYEQFSD